MKKEITFKNDKGQTLKGVVHIPDKKYFLKYPAVIFCHGYTGTKDTEKYVELAEALPSAGFVTLRFDFTCSGESEGTFKDITVTQEVADVSSAIDALLKLGMVDAHKIGVFGHSLAGAVVIFAAERDSRIHAVVASCPAVCPEPTFRQVMSPKGFRLWKKNGSAVPWNDEKFKTNYAFWEDYQRYDILCSARKIKAPLLVLQGSTDAIVAPAGARDLTHAASATLAFIDAGHDYAEPGAIQRVNELTMNWFKRHLR